MEHRKSNSERTSDRKDTWSSVDVAATTVYLRIERQANVYAGYYSLNGADWISVGQCLANLDVPLVGIGANHDRPETSETPARFDFFELDDGQQRAFLPLAGR